MLPFCAGYLAGKRSGCIQTNPEDMVLMQPGNDDGGSDDENDDWLDDLDKFLPTSR
jgi:hypothetical protein